MFTNRNIPFGVLLISHKEQKPSGAVDKEFRAQGLRFEELWILGGGKFGNSGFGDTMTVTAEKSSGGSTRRCGILP